MAIDVAGVESTIDAAYSGTYEPMIRAQQAAYLAANGRYWQGLITHTAYPKDGATVVPDNLAAKPSYEALDWLDLNYPKDGLGNPVAIASQAEIHQYLSVDGPGYVVIIRWQASDTLNVYERSVNYGPTSEDWRTRGWRQRNAVAVG